MPLIYWARVGDAANFHLVNINLLTSRLATARAFFLDTDGEKIEGRTPKSSLRMFGSTFSYVNSDNVSDTIWEKAQGHLYPQELLGHRKPCHEAPSTQFMC